MATTAFPPLDKLDPENAWQAWQPSEEQPFDRKWAGHLYRRAAFGADHAQINRAVKQGVAKTLGELLNGQEGHEKILPFLEQTGKGIVKTGKDDDLRGWWVYCMIHSLHPLRERLTLFWHNHFATSITKVRRAALMLQQNVTLRKHALGKFPEFLLAMSKDPAMLVWLDSNSNVKGKANENYAREVMELFSLGVGNYTETDVKEAARAFTGWHVNDDKFTFVARLHDTGQKTILGKTGNWDGNDVLDILLKQPVAARFIVRKMYRYFIGETQSPPDSLIEPLAGSFRKSGYDVAALIKQMLASNHFFSGHAYRQKIKSPVDFALGAVLALAPKKANQVSLAGSIRDMGQSLFAPPNVKGWPEGKAWLNTSTVLARNNFARSLTSGELPYQLRQDLFTGNDKKKPEEIVDSFLDALVQGDVRGEARKKLIAFVEEGKKLKPEEEPKPGDKPLPRDTVPPPPPGFPPQGVGGGIGAAPPTFQGRVRAAAQMILALPESQLA